MANFTAFEISCLASVFVLLGIGFGKILWNWFIADFWLKFTYRHAIDISGEWFSERAVLDGGKETTVFNIKQYGWRLKGNMFTNAVNGDSAENKQFELDGLIQSDIVTFCYWNTNRRQRGTGSFTLEICNNCKVLRGISAYFAPYTSEVVGINIELIRRE